MRFRRPPPMREVIKGWFTMRERPAPHAEYSNLPETKFDWQPWLSPRSAFDPIFSAWQRDGLVEVGPTAVGLLSVSVEDHSSVQRPPTRLWSFLDRSQAEGLHRALGEWLARSEGVGGPET